MTRFHQGRRAILSVPEITLDEIEGLIARPLNRLRFPPPIESRYQLDRAAERRRHLVLFSIVGLLFFDVCVFLDFLLLPDIAWLGVVARFGIVTPVGLAATAVAATSRTVAGRELAGAVVSFSALAAVLGLTLLSNDALAAYSHFGALIIVMFANVVQRLDFRYAVGASTASLALYALAVPEVGHLPPAAALAAIVFMVCCVALTLFANHRMEAQLRLAYLYRLRDGERNQQLDVLTRLDPLTGLGNRRQFDLEMGQLLRNDLTGAVSVAVLMLDVDHFKSYNDRYGHPAGDLCLKRLAAILIRETDRFDAKAFRLGGEEVGIIAVGAGLGDGIRLGEQIRNSVERAAIPHDNNRPVGRVTVSVGVSACVSTDTISTDDLIAGADRALYAAKRSGRNQVWPSLGGNAQLAVNADASAAAADGGSERLLRRG